MTYLPKNENKSNLEVRNENFSKANQKEMSCQEIKSNIPKKTKDVYKPSGEFES